MSIRCCVLVVVYTQRSCVFGDFIKKRCNYNMESKVIERLGRLHMKSGKSLSFLVNRAVEAYKRTEIEDYHELKKEIARKINMLQRQMDAVIDAEKASIKQQKGG